MGKKPYDGVPTMQLCSQASTKKCNAFPSIQDFLFSPIWHTGDKVLGNEFIFKNLGP